MVASPWRPDLHAVLLKERIGFLEDELRVSKSCIFVQPLDAIYATRACVPNASSNIGIEVP